jgi:hypothetical protein
VHGWAPATDAFERDGEDALGLITVDRALGISLPTRWRKLRAYQGEAERRS